MALSNISQLAISVLLFLPITLVQCATLPTEYLIDRSELTLEVFNGSTEINHLARRALNPVERNMLDGLHNGFEGIFWEKAYPGAAGDIGSAREGGCSIDKFNILVEASKNALKLAEFRGLDLYRKGRAFNRYFVQNSIAPIGGRWTSSKGAQDSFAEMKHNMLLPSRFPVDGVGRKRRGQRVTYQCKDTETIPQNTKGCAGTAEAYTVDLDFSPDGWTIVFCDRYFQNTKYLNELLDGPKIPEDSLGDAKYISFEQKMLHEWLHADIMGYTQHITDVRAAINGQPEQRMYGKSQARDFAWKDMGGKNPKVNLAIVRNVENYVWYFVDKMYGNQWGWTGNGNSYPDKGAPTRRDEKAITAGLPDLGDEDSPVATLGDAVWPDSCHPRPAIDVEEDGITCDYTAPPDIPDDAIVCLCGVKGCTPESPACCADSSCGR